MVPRPMLPTPTAATAMVEFGAATLVTAGNPSVAVAEATVFLRKRRRFMVVRNGVGGPCFTKGLDRIGFEAIFLFERSEKGSG